MFDNLDPSLIIIQYKMLDILVRDIKLTHLDFIKIS